MFHIRQKVVCIKTINTAEIRRAILRYMPSLPVLNGVYTVRGDTLAYGAQYLYLDEIHNPIGYWTEIGLAEVAFWCGYFRPIVEHKTDISVFTALLNPTPQKVRESIGYDLGFTKEQVGTS